MVTVEFPPYPPGLDFPKWSRIPAKLVSALGRPSKPKGQHHFAFLDFFKKRQRAFASATWHTIFYNKYALRPRPKVDVSATMPQFEAR